MPRVSVYLPDDLYRRAKQEGLNLSALTQRAVEQQPDRDPNRAWIAAVRERPCRSTSEIDLAALMEEVRNGFDV